LGGEIVYMYGMAKEGSLRFHELYTKWKPSTKKME
jgi:hypothetical protein